MNSRHQARAVAFQILYRYDLAAQSAQSQPPKGAQLAAELVQHFEHFTVPETLRAFAAELVSGTLAEKTALDARIAKQAAHWKLERMPIVDRNILRLALYELTHFEDTPPAVVIDEAIELSKQFGTAETPSFVNGVLDALLPGSLETG